MKKMENSPLRKLFFPGQEVTLKANKKEGWKKEDAIVVGLDRTTMVVEVKKWSPGDDGLREVEYSQAIPKERVVSETVENLTRAYLSKGVAFVGGPKLQFVGKPFFHKGEWFVELKTGWGSMCYFCFDDGKMYEVPS